jgi:hypothetical protein
VEVDTNRYSVPWRWIGRQVRVLLGDGQVRIDHAETALAVHAEVPGRRQRVIDPRHLDGIVGAGQARPEPTAPATAATLPAAPPPELLRPLSDYEAALGGGWS